MQLQRLEITSYVSISSDVVFENEPEALVSAFSRREIPGYSTSPTSLRDALVAFLGGQGLPDPNFGAEIGMPRMADDLGENLDDPGCRARLFYRAATSSRGKVLTSISVRSSWRTLDSKYHISHVWPMFRSRTALRLIAIPTSRKTLHGDGELASGEFKYRHHTSFTFFYIQNPIQSRHGWTAISSCKYWSGLVPEWVALHDCSRAIAQREQSLGF
jgi:hypothetical protein